MQKPLQANTKDREDQQSLLEILQRYQKDPQALAEMLKMMEAQNKKTESIRVENQLKGEALERENRRIKNEQKRKIKNLPIYSRRQEIMDHVQDNKFTIVVGDTGCGKSTQLPQYLFEHYEKNPGAKILWILPRKLPTISLAKRTCEEMDIRLGEEIGYEILNKEKSSNKTILKFIIDSVLINEIIDKRAKVGPYGKIKLDYSIVVLDEVHERNLYTDILLATLKEVAIQSDMKLLVTSATINEAIFENYFDTKSFHVKGRPFPVKIEYNPKPEGAPPIGHVVNTIQNIVTRFQRPDYEYRGHILVFTSGIDDINKISTELCEPIDPDHFELNLDEYEILPLHGLLTPIEQDAVFRDIGKIKIILSTRMAETALTIEGVRVVVDIGFDKEVIYDSIKRMNITADKWIAQSSAIQRAGRAGRTTSGLCIRLYSEEDFETLSRNKIPEIQRMDLGKVVLKLKAMGVGNLREFSFVEKPNEDILLQTLDHLKDLGALTEDEMLTKVGQAMLKLETDPDFSKVIFEGLERGCAEEIIKIIAMIGISNRIYSRGFEDMTKEAADRRKLGFCHDKGDFLTLLGIFWGWNTRVNQEDQKHWCQQNYLNFYALKEASRTIGEIKRGLEMAKPILKNQLPVLQNPLEAQEEGIPQENWRNRRMGKCVGEFEDSIIKCFLRPFYRNICLYTIPQVGYTLLRDNLTLKIHGSSSLALLQDFPKYIVCLDINKTTYNHAKIASYIKFEWLEELFPNYQQNPRLEYFAKTYKFNDFIITKLPRLILSYFANEKTDEIRAIASTSETTFYPDFREEKLHVYSTAEEAKELEPKLFKIIDKINDEIADETREITLTLKSRGVFKSGGEIKEILLGSESRTITFENFEPSWTTESLHRVFSKFGGKIISLSSEIDHSTKLLRGTLKMEKSETIRKITEHYKDERELIDFEAHWSPESPAITPVCFSMKAGAKRALRVKVEWYTGTSNNTCLMNFKNAEAVTNIYTQMKALRIVLRGREICVAELGTRKNLIDSGIPTLTTAGNKKVLLIKNISSDIDEIDIEDMMKFYGLDKDFNGAKVFRDSESSEESLDENSEDMKAEDYLNIIREALFSKIGIQEDEIVRIIAAKVRNADSKDPRDVDYKRRVEIDVYDLSLAKKIVQFFDGNEGFPQLTNSRLHAGISFTKRRTLKWDKFRIVEKELEEVYDQIREEYGSDIRIFRDKVTDKQDQRRFKEVGVRIITKDPLTLDECCNRIDPLMRGARFYLKTGLQFKKATLPSGFDRLQSIERKYNVYIELDKKRRQLLVFGKKEGKEKALEEFIAFFVGKEGNNYINVNVSFRNRPIKHILKEGGKLLVEVSQKYNVAVEVKLLTKEIVIAGFREKVQEALKEVRQLVNLYAPKEEINETECPICLSDFVDGYRIQVCGHKFCFSCLELQLEQQLQYNPKFPLCCSACDQDETPFSIKDLLNILKGEQLNMLWEKSLEFYLNKNEEDYFRCFSPNCPQIFRNSPEKDFLCDYCLRHYCKKCKLEAHAEMDCNDKFRADFIHALKEQGIDFRECPECDYVIERIEGCFNMKCVKCCTKFCWLCSHTFASDREGYVHLTEVHENIGDLDPENLDELHF